MPEFKTARRTGFPAGLVLSYLLSQTLARCFVCIRIHKVDFQKNQQSHHEGFQDRTPQK